MAKSASAIETPVVAEAVAPVPPVNPVSYLDSPASEARMRVGTEAYQRQRQNKPSRPLRKFRVAFNGVESLFDAADRAEAWARFCDQRQEYPSPKSPGIAIEEVTVTAA